MRIFAFNHRPHDLAHHSVHAKQAHNWNRGSIMIWTVMLGLLLTSVFFFFSMRQRAMVNVQRDTATIQNAKLFLESYADYLENKCKGVGCASDPTINSDSITGTVTQKVASIENAVDFGKQQEYKFTGSIYVEWNKCLKTGVQDFSGDLLVNDVLYNHSIESGCAANEEYDDVIGPISVSGTPTPFTIKTLNTPFDFRIKPQGGIQLIDNQWHLDLSKDLDYGKKTSIKRTFK